MLIKQLKYDLKYVLKFLLVFYFLAVFFGGLTRLFLSFENSLVMEIIGRICQGTAISMMFSILINTLTRSWVRMSRNFYSDEAYLTHTLPIKKQTLYLSKLLCSFLMLLLSFVVCIGVLMIMFYSDNFFETLELLLTAITMPFDISVTATIIFLISILFIEIFVSLLCGFSGIIIGHKFNKSKGGLSFVFGFITYIAVQIVVLGSVVICGLFDKNIMDVFTTSQITNADSFKALFVIVLGVYIIIAVIINIINIFLFKKGVNVD
ncbi:MAG: hypothetical protein E7560_01925 [Ruminococcaceae bacterium]|nr:hypothetical protein [Oscillospiraceae bacterium]